jgi:hypothetical protein
MIETRAILVSVHLAKMSGARIDKRITERVKTQEYATGKAGKWSTDLFPNGALEPINAIDGEIRKYFLKQTLPWADSGVRLLPQSRFFDYSNELSNFDILRQQKVDQFFLHYDDHVREAQSKLQGLFRSELYPSEPVARKKFVFTSDVQPVPSSGDFRTDAPKAEMKAMEESLAAKMERAAELAERDLAERLVTPLAKLVEKLNAPTKDGKSPVFRDTLLTNIRDIVAKIPAFNVTGNPAFDDLHRSMTQPGALSHFTAGMIRDVPELRKNAAEQAGLFLTKLEDMFGPAPVQAEDAA